MPDNVYLVEPVNGSYHEMLAKLVVMHEEWNIENGLLAPTLPESEAENGRSEVFITLRFVI